MVSLARKTLLHDKARFLSTVGAVAFAVSLILVQIGLFLGVLGKASIPIERARADIWVTSKKTPTIDFAHPFSENAVLRVRGVPGVARADNLIVTYAPIKLPTGAQENCLVYGLENFEEWNLPWLVEEGSVRELNRGLNILMDRSATRRFGPFQVGDYREVVARRFKIIGVTREADSFSTVPILFMSYRNLQGLSELLDGNSTYILVRLRPGADAGRVAEEIRRRLPYNDVYSRADWARQSRSYWVTTTGLGVQMGLTVFLGITVGVLTVALTLYSSALEHVKEFATVKAIGGSSWEICRIIGEQAVIVGLSGYLVGLLLSISLKSLIAKQAGLGVTVSPHFAVTVLMWTVVLCLAAAMLSFRRLVRIDPMLVLRG